MHYTSIKQRSVAKKDAFLPDPMAWMDCSRALLKDFFVGGEEGGILKKG